MDTNLIARASMTINAPVSRVWKALVDPKDIKQYMFRANVVSEWKKGSPIVWKGQWQGKPYEDKGRILRMEPERVLQYSHYSPLSGLPDKPDSYHTVTIELSGGGKDTRISLAQDNNPTDEARRSGSISLPVMSS